MKHRIFAFTFFVICIFSTITSYGETAIVEKKKFVIENFKTMSGTTLPELLVGWQSMGTLNSTKSNVILVSHYLLGTSHFAGKYNPDDKRAGYWDYIIGPGKAVDTNKYFVLSIDSPANANTKNPNVFTTGPASINPETGKQYGTDFPVITARDVVNVQHVLLSHLGINELHATMGASMGSHISLEWASAFPEMVKRVISVVGHGESNVWSQTQLGTWGASIRNDPNWNKGDYYDGAYPSDGMAESLSHLFLAANHGHAYEKKFKAANAQNREPWIDIKEDFESTNLIYDLAVKRAAIYDPNSYLYLLRLCQLFRLGHGDSLEAGIKPLKAKILLLPSEFDEIIGPYMTENFRNLLIRQNKHVVYDEIYAPWGHLDGIIAIGTKADVISKFLDET